MKKKVNIVEAVGGRGGEDQKAAVKSGYSQWGFALLQSLKSPPTFQSLPYSISQMMHSQKNLKIKTIIRRVRSARGIKKAPMSDLAERCFISPRRLGSARTIFCFFFFFPEVTVSKRGCCCPLVWLDW